MAYTSLTRVEALMARVVEHLDDGLSASTRVSASTVSDWIDSYGGQVNVILSAQGIAVPVTSPPYFLAWLEQLVAEGVTATVLRSWFQDNKTGEAEAAWGLYERRWLAGLKGMQDGTMIPSGLDESEGGIPDGEWDIEHIFTVGEQF